MARLSLNIHLITLCIFTIVLAYLVNDVLGITELYNTSLSEQLPLERVNEIIKISNKYSWMQFLLVPFFLFIKISTITIALWVGCFFSNLRTSYNSMNKIVLQGEFVFLFVFVAKLIWFGLIHTNYSLADVVSFYPFSVLSILGYEGLSFWYVYPLQVINLFEVLYWLILINQIAREFNIKVSRALNIVAGSYGVGLFIWVLIVMFITINFS